MTKNMSKKTELLEKIDPTGLAYIRKASGREPIFSEAHVDPINTLSEKQRIFLRAYGNSSGITKTGLRESGATRQELQEWLTDDNFKKAYKEAQDDWVEELRKAAMLRATTKSDVLLMFLLKAMKPDVFDDDVRKSQYVGIQNNKDAIPVRATLVRDNTIVFTSAQGDELRDILQAESEDS